MQENNAPSYQAVPVAQSSSSRNSSSGGINQAMDMFASGRLTPSDSAHVLRSVAEYAELRAKSDSINAKVSLRLRGVADRCRSHAADFSAPASAMGKGK